MSALSHAIDELRAVEAGGQLDDERLEHIIYTVLDLANDPREVAESIALEYMPSGSSITVS